MLQSFILASLIVGAYGSLYTIPNSTLQLGLIDPITGQVTSFGPSYDNYDITPQLTAIDLVHDLFYTVKKFYLYFNKYRSFTSQPPTSHI